MIRSSFVLLVGLVLALLSTDGLSQEIQIKRALVTAANGNNVATDVDTDPQDKTQRLLLLLPGQPLLLHLDLTIEGKPFRMAREKLVDSMLKTADTDGDGKSTWDEALANPRFGFGRLGYQSQNDLTRRALLKRLDVNGDGLVDRSEARQFLAQQFGAAFSIANSPYPAQGQNNLRDLLDTDKDQIVSAEEWAAASDRLKSRDSDDDDIVTLADLGGGPSTYGLRNRGLQAAATQWAVVLGSDTKAVPLYNLLLEERYGKENKLRVADLPRFIILDKNRNGEIELDEIPGLQSMLPHVFLMAGFGASNPSSGGLVFQALAPSVGKEQPLVVQSDKEVSLNLSSVVLRFAMTDNANAQFTFSLAQAKKTLDQLDADKNGYLDEKESSVRGGKQQFLMWDENSDGKVYAEEIKSFYEMQQAPLNSQIQAVVAEDGDVLFSLLDTSGDGRLSLRELRNAPARLKTLDKNDDGRITAQELPTRMTVSLGQGNAAYQRLNIFQAQPRPAIPKSSGPDWFVRMDRNSDGDLTLREFLGTPEQFKKLDADGDGFIDGKEAAAK